ncbi:MAG: GNAT family N-acetyltransferase [Eubacteriales bacterium]
MIEFANKKDIEQIISLWQECFGDKKEYISFFLNRCFTSKNCLVYRENNRIVSMLFLLEGNVKVAGEILSSFYIYAACTAKDYRNRGIMSRLIQWSIDYSELEQIDLICLVPSEETLFDYYARLGFLRYFKRKEFSLNRNQINAISENCSETSNPTIEQITELRNNALSMTDYFIWDTNSVGYAILENELIGGKTVFAKKNETIVGYAIFIEEDEQVIIKEFCALKGYTGSVTGLITNASKAEKFFFSLQVNFPMTADNFFVRDNGMIKPISVMAEKHLINITNAYFGLALE